jgi:hypothetical protein
MRLAGKHDDFVELLPEALALLLGAEESEFSVQIPRAAGLDAVMHGAGNLFAVQVTSRASAAAVRDAAARLLDVIGKSDESPIPLVAVPYMGEVGRGICQDNAVNWLHFSGNGRIVAEGLRVNVQGRPSRYKASGRPENVWSQKRTTDQMASCSLARTVHPA